MLDLGKAEEIWAKVLAGNYPLSRSLNINTALSRNACVLPLAHGLSGHAKLSSQAGP